MLDPKLRTFLILCQTKSFTKTAESLHITQPAVSHHLKYLEAYYQTKLYEYNNRKFQLTPSGEILYQFVNSVNSDSERLKAQLPSLSTNVPELRIGAEQSAGESFLPHLIISFLKEMPKCKLKIISENYSSLSTMLDNGDLDFFLFDGVVSTTKYDYHELGVGNVICVCSPSHPLAEKEVSIQEVYNNTLILGAENTPSRIRLENIFQENGILTYRFSNHIEVSNSLSCVKELILHNAGISFLYKSGVAKELAHGNLKQIHIHHFHEQHAYNLICVRNSYFNPSQAYFIQFCQDFLKQWNSGNITPDL